MARMNISGIDGKPRSEANRGAAEQGNKRGEKMRNVENRGDEEEDQSENQGDSSSDVTDRDEPFNAGVFGGDGVNKL